MLDSLIEQAKDISSDKQKKLVEHVTAQFVERASLQRPEEIETYNGILEGVYDKLPAEDRQKISDRLTDVEATSSVLAAKVAKDDLPIARRMIAESKSLKENDLLKLASETSQEHMLEIAKRDHLSSRLTKKLIDRGGKAVHKSLALNLGAEMTPEDFEMIVKELPQQMGEKVRHLRKSNEQLLEDLFKDDSEAMMGPPIEKKEARIPVRQWMMGIKSGQITLTKAISQMAMEKNLYDITLMLSVISSLEHKYVLSLMNRFDSSGIATLCRASGIDDTAYSGICTCRCHHLKFPTSTGNKWLTNYHVLDPTDAKRLLELMKYKLTSVNGEAA